MLDLRSKVKDPEAIITLSPDDKAVCLEAISKLGIAMKTMHDWVKDGTLNNQMRTTMLSLAEHHIADISEILGYDSVSQANLDEKHREVREANIKIGELEKKLGSSKPIDGLREQLERLSRIVKDWWHDHGFQYVAELRFTDYGHLEIEFGFMLDDFASIMSDKPVTEAKQKQDRIAQLQEHGFQLVKVESRRWDVIDNDNNRSLLLKLLHERFPSAKVHDFGSWSYREIDQFYLRRVKLMVYDLADIEVM